MTRIASLAAVVCLASTAWPLTCLWRATCRTALRSASGWAACAVLFWMATAALELIRPERPAWEWLEQVRLLAAALALGPLVAVLGARWPGTRAWNLIVLAVVVVFSLPAITGWALGRQAPDRAGMDTPLAFFFFLVALVGVANYLPTRFALAALAAGGALAARVAAVGAWELAFTARERLHGCAELLAGAAVWLAFLLRPRASLGLSGAWQRLRDGWGVVWALRFRERWNAAAEHYGWSMRLTWHGFVATDSAHVLTADEWQAAVRQFEFQLRRFAEPEPFIGLVSGDAPEARPASGPAEPERADGTSN